MEENERGRYASKQVKFIEEIQGTRKRDRNMQESPVRLVPPTSVRIGPLLLPLTPSLCHPRLCHKIYHGWHRPDSSIRPTCGFSPVMGANSRIELQPERLNGGRTCQPWPSHGLLLGRLQCGRRKFFLFPTWLAAFPFQSRSFYQLPSPACLILLL